MEQGDVLSAGTAARVAAAATRRITSEELRRRFAGTAGRPSRAPTVRGDHDLNPGMGTTGELLPAAVLVPLVERAEGLTIMLTQRTAHLAAHAGQISFPGGRMEPGDASDEATALRETQEEIGLCADRIELLGRLDTYLTRTGFRVTPVVGLVHPPFTLAPDPFEVAEVFEVPLAFVLDPTSVQRQSRIYNGVERSFYVFPYQQRRIWGATAGMLVNLCNVLGES
jgi:8-oxo-dGTP pyrophosphatase MutT (NUDIX family)